MKCSLLKVLILSTEQGYSFITMVTKKGKEIKSKQGKI